MPVYRVQYAPKEGVAWAEVAQDAGSPEEAARLVTGEDLVRGAGHAHRHLLLRAKVYFLTSGGMLNMVRLYRRPARGPVAAERGVVDS